MKISVVTAVYNRVDTIGQALESVASQRFANVEHIIVDGASTDGTLDVIRAQTRANMTVQSAPDKGIYDALNKGIAAATGDVIGVMHSDDFFAHQTVLADIAACLEISRADAVYGDLDYVAAHHTDRIVRRWRSGAYARDRLRRGWMPPHPALFVRRDVFAEHGQYDTSYQIAADYDAILRWMWRGNIRVAYLPEVLVKMRVGGESNRSLGRMITKSREDYRALRANGVGGIGALAWKNASKIPQFFVR